VFEKNKKIFILLGHTDNESLNAYLAKHYERGAEDAGHDVRRMNLGDMDFDPVLHRGYKEIQELEPDLKKFQENLKWCDHFVLFYPVWHGGPPAKLKGIFDRAFLPGFAFKWRKYKFLGWRKLLTTRSARVVVTTGSLPIVARVMFGDYTNEIRKNLLGFSGFKPVKLCALGLAENIGEEKAKKWSKKIRRMGRRGK